MTNALLGGRAALLVVFVLVTCLWWPALWQGKIMIYGDSGLQGLPFLWLHGDALAGRESLLWSSRIFGGHPLFAEGQGGFANPLTIFSVWLCGPLYALGFVHWLNMLVGAAGVFSLCRILGISCWSATFAAIAVVFSGSWLSSQQNLPMSATMAWIPWLIAAAEYWLRKPSVARAALLAFPAALLVFSGYPQLAHGAMLYVLVSLSAQFFQGESREDIVRRWREFLLTGLLAVVLAIGLSAIQFLPLLELVGQSHRSQGTAILFDGAASYGYHLKGLLYLYSGTADEGANSFSLASIAVLALAMLLPLFRVPVRIVGQILGVLLLFNLGMGATSPFFRLVYEHNLIPGLHYFRIVQLYLSVAVIGFAVVAAYVLDALSGAGFPALRGIFRWHPALLGMAAMACAGGLLALCYWLYVPVYAKLHFLAPLLMVLCYLVLHLSGRRSWFPVFSVLILAVDVLTLRIHPFDFQDRAILGQAAEIRAIASESDVQDYRVMDASIAGLMVFLGPADPTIGKAYRKVLKTLSPFPSALLWNIPSIDGVLALWLARRDLLDAVFTEEIEGKAGTPAGLRLIDILGIRYLSRDATLSSPGLSLYAHDQEQSSFIYRNALAKPRFQVYWDARVVDTAEEALAGLRAAQSETLFIEKQRGEMLTLLPAPAECQGCAVSKPVIGVVEAQAMRYRVNVDMPREGWLFLADANYPGWQATVNGVRQPIYSAQVLGKAVRLQAGRNQVTISYVPWSFYIGATLTAFALLAILLILMIDRRSLRQRPEAS